MTWKLPAGWDWVAVEDLAECVEYGSSSKTSDDASGVPVLRMGNIKDGRLDLSSLKYLPKQHHEFPDLLLEPGDVLFNRTNSPELVGKTAVFEGPRGTTSFASYLLRVRLRGLEPKLFSWFLNSEFGRRWVASVAVQQTGQANVNSSKLKALQVPVPPLDIQRRIVAKLDELLAQSRAARAQLEAVPALVEQYRQAVLAAAFRGDLTKEWREKNPDVEPASKLLERIRVERRRQWEAAELAKMKAKGKAPKDDKWKAKYEAPEDMLLGDGVPELPSGWCWAAAAEVVEPGADVVYGIVQPGPEVPKGVPYVRAMDVADGTVLVEQLRKTSPAIAERYRRSELSAGDVLLGIIRATKVAVVPSGLDRANITQGTARLRAALGVSNRWLAGWLASPDAQARLHAMYRGIDMPGLNLRDVRRLPVPLAPVAEQGEVVRRLDALQGQRLLALRALGIEKVDALERSLLAKAFRGELDLDGSEGELVRHQGGGCSRGGDGRAGRRTA